MLCRGKNEMMRVSVNFKVIKHRFCLHLHEPALQLILSLIIQVCVCVRACVFYSGLVELTCSFLKVIFII